MRARESVCFRFILFLAAAVSVKQKKSLLLKPTTGESSKCLCLCVSVCESALV